MLILGIESSCDVTGIALYSTDPGGGLLAHARALSAILSPTTNSYKRLVPGYEAPIYLAWSKRNRSAAVRIPAYHGGEKAKRIEYRTPDPSCNGYLAFAAMLMAGLDGIENKIDPGQPLTAQVEKIAGKKVPLVEAPRRAGDPPALYADSTLAQRELGWKVKFGDIESIVDTAWKWHSTHPKGFGDRNR